MRSEAVNPNIIRRMEFMDRSLFSEQEQLCLDLFLFSFYSGGMANVDVINLTWDMINEQEKLRQRMNARYGSWGQQAI